jgi:short-subunit dehydrogenase
MAAVTLSRRFAEKYGPWAIVTGASSGIGEQVARRLAEARLNVILVARRGDRLERLSAEISGRSRVEVEGLCLDLSHSDFLEPLLAACIGKDVGLVVSNAGSGLKGPHVEASPEKLTAMLDLNCRAPILLARSFAPRLIERGRGGLLFTGSIEAVRGFPYSAGYSATKAFLQSFGEALWAELAPHGVDVLVVNPGPTDTEILPNQGMSRDDMVGLMQPERVASMALARLGRGPVFTPGLLNRAFARSLSLLPRRVALKLAAKGMLDAIEKGRKASGPPAGRNA